MTNNDAYEVEFKEILGVVWRYKIFVVFVSIIFVSIAFFAVKGMKDIYKSEILLSPSSEDSGLDLSGQLGGIASLAGINLKDKKANKTDLAISMLQSRDFIYRFVEKHEALVPLMASAGWDREKNKLIINENLYDVERNVWIRKVGPPYSSTPSLQEAYKVFIKIFTVSKMKETGLVTLSLKHHSPYIAKSWLELIVKDINNEIRQLDLDEAQRSITYLSDQINKTTVSESRNMLYSLIEQQTRVVMLANVREDYVFKTIDPPIAPLEKDGPRRLIILLITFVLSFIVTSVLVLFYNYVLKRK